MPSQNGNPKHIKSFWPLVIIFVLAAIVGGLVYWFQFQFSTDTDLNSMQLVIHRRAATTKKSPTGTKSTSTTTQPVK